MYGDDDDDDDDDTASGLQMLGQYDVNVPIGQRKIHV